MKNDGRRGTIDSKEFIDMFKEVATRPEVYFLLIRWGPKINMFKLIRLWAYRVYKKGVTSSWLQILGHKSNYYLQYKRKKLLLLPILYIC